MFFSLGPALAWSVPYSMTHVAIQFLGRLGIHHRQDGYGGAYYVVIAATSLLCCIVGLLLGYRWSSLFVGRTSAFWATVGIMWASPLLYYLYLAPDYSHAFSVFTAACFFSYWWKTRGETATGVWFRWGMLAGLVFLVRWNDTMLIAPALMVESLRVLGARLKFQHVIKLYAAGAVGFLLVASIQFAAWQYFFGRPWARSHAEGVMQFQVAGLWGSLISSRHGLFTWTPITLFSVIGLVRLAKRQRELAAVCIAGFLLLTVSNCLISDWWGANAFGMRRLITATPLFVLGLGVLLNDMRQGGFGERVERASFWLVPAAISILICWNSLLVVQYSLGLISHDQPVSLVTIVTNQPVAINTLRRLLLKVF